MRTRTVFACIAAIAMALPASGAESDGAQPASQFVPRYRVVGTTGGDLLPAMRSELDEEGMQILLKVNRRDSRHLQRRALLVVPESVGSLLDHSPFPRELPSAASLPKLILVSQRVQAFAAFEYGRQINWGPVSTGRREQPTPATLYHTNWRSRRRASTIDPSWIMNWYFNIHTSMGLALHQYAMPGYPASYGCIRLLEEDAVWIYDWAESGTSSPDGRDAGSYGTPVVVFGEYDYDSHPPWEDLATDPLADRVSAEDLAEVLERYLPALERRARGKHRVTARDATDRRRAGSVASGDR